MRCDKYCPRCGKLDETVTHAIFDCPPILQVQSTLTSSNIFPVPSIYTNMDYLFWRKNSIIQPEQDKYPYPWIICYIWKARNDKLFRGIYRDPLELVRHAERECEAQFDANEVVQLVVQDDNNDELQVISLGNICLLNGSWTSSTHLVDADGS